MRHHVVLGAGPVGRATAAQLSATGVPVTLVSRSPLAQEIPGVRHRRGDVLEARFLDDAVPDGAVVYQTLGLPYDRWERGWPPLQAAVVARCVAAGARLVSFENLYGYGAPGPEPFGEDAALQPCSRKGRVRAEMIQALDQARQAHGLEVLHVRASDLFGPGVWQSALGDEVLGRIQQGKAPRGVGDPDAPHTWTWLLDAARTLAAVGLADAPPRVIHVPSEPPRSLRQVVEACGGILGRPLALTTTPRWMLRLLGLFNPLIAELPEMLYEFEAAFVMGDGVARRELGLSSTPFDQALRETLDAS